MNACLECGDPLYRGPRTGGPRTRHADEVLCRECQRSPVVQLRVQLERARQRGMCFEQAWQFATDRIRWPHDTTHRRDWKDILGVERAPGTTPGKFRRNREQVLATWRRAFEAEPVRDSTPLEELVAA